jgi:hypothetical protein
VAAVRQESKTHVIFSLLICFFYSYSIASACDEENKRQSGPNAPRVFSALQTLQWRPSEYFQSLDAQRAATAIMTGTVDPLKKLHAEGFDWNTQGREGITLLLWAFLADEFEIFCQLLEWGADPDLAIQPTAALDVYPNVRSFSTGDSVTIIAATTPRRGKWLGAAISHGGDPNVLASVGRETAFTTFVGRSQPAGQSKTAAFELMIKRGADIQHRNEQGDGVLIKTLLATNWDFTARLLELGADTTCYDQRNWQLVHHLAFLEDQRRLDNEQFPAKKQEWLESPLRKDFDRMVELLTERGFPLEEAIADLKRRNESINGIPYMTWRRMQREDKDACTEQPASKAVGPGAKEDGKQVLPKDR